MAQSMLLTQEEAQQTDKTSKSCPRKTGQQSSRRQSVIVREVRTAGNHVETVIIRPQDGYFIRDLERDEVICPAGNVLHRKCTKSNGYARYMSKASCSRCEMIQKCYSGKRKWKEIDFSDGARVVRCRNWTKDV